MSGYYPAFLRLVGRRCLVVGGGQVAQRKVARLIEAGALVDVVAPRATRVLADWAAAGRISLAVRPYESEDLEGAVLVFAATDDEDLNRRVVADAERRGVLANSATSAVECHFIVPAKVERGPLTIAVSTNGLDPGFAAGLRKALEQWLTDEVVAQFRDSVRARAARRADTRRRAQASRQPGDDGVVGSTADSVGAGSLRHPGGREAAG